MNPQPELSNAEMIDVLRGVDLFEMLSDADLERVIAAGQKRRLGQGDYLFRAGDPPDSIHVVMGGAIEVVRSTPDSPEPTPVAYISPGEAIGDMALFTGASRRSAGRVPEFADVLTLTRAAFEELTVSVSGYGLQIAAVFAKRLEAFIQHMRGQKRQKELSGKLKFFDLPTVVQTLVSGNQTGVLTLTDDKRKTYAEVLLLDGAVERARCGLLEGEEAFFQLFQTDDAGEFFFRTVREPNADSISKVVISMSAMNLLMESARLTDELPGLRRGLPEPRKLYWARTEDLQWEDDDTSVIAQAVLTKLREPHAIADLIDNVPCSTFTLYRVVAKLFETDQIG
jgi:CRP-like cAMP-binding protein